MTANVLYEAKGEADRMSVRLALGQTLDCGQHVRRWVPEARLAVLMPEPPAADLVTLLRKHVIGCVVAIAADKFADLTGLQRCR